MPPEPTSSCPAQPFPERRPPHSVDLLHSLLEGTPDAIYFKDRESRFTLISRRLARLLGLADPQEAYGRTDRDFFSPEHAEQALADERRIMATGEPIVDLVEKETWPDGRITWASTTKMPLRDAAGAIVGTFGLSRDVTARIAAEQRLRTTHRDLVEVSRRAAVAEAAVGQSASLLSLLELAQQAAERMRGQTLNLDTDSIADLASRLLPLAPTEGSPHQQLVTNLQALVATASTGRRGLIEDLGEIDRSLAQLAQALANRS